MSVIVRVAATAVCVVVLLPDREARACRKGTLLHNVLPTKGATDVPTNVRIWATYKAVGVKKPKLRLLDAKGRVVKARLEHHDQCTINALAVQVMSLTPGGVLSAKARYTIELWTHDRGEFKRVHAFKTGARVDQRPPASVAVSAITASRFGRTCSCCSPRLALSVGGQAVAGAAFYHAYEGRRLVRVSSKLPVVVELPPATKAGRRCLELRAVDLAGNRSARSKKRCLSVPAPDHTKSQR